MLVNTTMAELSDLTFRTAFIIYIVALLMACVYYGRVLAVVDVRRERRTSTTCLLYTSPSPRD